jgi:hypothetical protein
LFGKTIYPKLLHQKFLAVKQFFQKSGQSIGGEPVKYAVGREFVAEMTIFSCRIYFDMKMIF